MGFRALPDNDDVLISRKDVHLYGGPAAQTLAIWATSPSKAPIPLPYTIAGRQAVYRSGTIRALLAARTFLNSAERRVADARRKYSD